MHDEGKAPAGVPAPTGAEGKGLPTKFPVSNSIPAADNRQFKVSGLLSHGQVNAVPLRHLCSLTGLDGRTVRAMIAAERRTGAAILSDNATGYFLPANEEEKARFVRSMRHRAKEILYAAAAVERGK